MQCLDLLSGFVFLPHMSAYLAKRRDAGLWPSPRRHFECQYKPSVQVMTDKVENLSAGDLWLGTLTIFVVTNSVNAKRIMPVPPGTLIASC
jgi:hypothetical protein